VALVTGTPVFNNPEGFEGGLGDWAVDKGTWQVGVPTSGPGAAFSGTKCASLAVTGGNYQPNVDSRFTSPPLAVPTANQSPRLRFWQWYSIGGGDHATVEIMPAGSSTWRTISADYGDVGNFNDVRNGGGVWTRASLDLSGYAGQSVQIAFHFASDGGSAVAPNAGWFVDDVALVTGTPVFNNPEGFEGGLGDWAVDKGTWQVGVPTSGPGAAFSGTNCASLAVTGGNYQPNVDSRFISPPLAVPTPNQSPRLRFWHWYSIGGGDHATVEIMPAGSSTWTSISPDYGDVGNVNAVRGGGGVWTRPSLDLSLYAGQSVQIAFHFASDGGSAVAPNAGWFVDDVALVTGTPVFNNPEGFEGGLGDWAVDKGTWQVGVPTSGPGAAYTGTNCAATGLAGNYPANMDTRLISPSLTLPAADASPGLRFRGWFRFASGDQGVVEIKASSASSWTPLYTNSGISSGWTYPYIGLSSYGGETVQIAFHATSDSGSVDAGWYVDDVSIQSSGAPVILTPPASQTDSVGSSATLNVGAGGDSPLSYQWRFNSNSIAGATNASLTFANLQLTNTGYYDVVVTNLSGSITSTPPALLQVVIAFAGVDIGTPGASGSFTKSNGVYTYTVTGSGEGTDGSADVFYFASQTLAGDAQIMARLQSLQGGDPELAEAGVMIRESLDPGSKQASFSVNASSNVIFRRRLAANDLGIQNSSEGTNYLQGTNYIWLRLMRMGNTFVAHYSTNGLNWQYMWFTTVNMSNQVQVGLAVTAHHYGELATATFDNVTIGSLTPLPGAWPLPGPEVLLGGEPWTTAEFQRVGGFKFLVGGVVGDQFSVNWSTNAAASLASWQSLGAVTNTYGVVPFIDPQALTNPVRFYRLQRVGP
jgi:hypothetical protein